MPTAYVGGRPYGTRMSNLFEPFFTGFLLGMGNLAHLLVDPAMYPLYLAFVGLGTLNLLVRRRRRRRQW